MPTTRTNPIFSFLGALVLITVPTGPASAETANTLQKSGWYKSAHSVEILSDGTELSPQDHANSEADGSSTLREEWNDWHRRLANEIYARFKKEAEANFANGGPYECKINYMVARDGRIGNVRVITPSKSPAFDTMLVTIVKNLANDPILKFPAGSKRKFIEKGGTFAWNFTRHVGRSYRGDFGPYPADLLGPYPGLPYYMRRNLPGGNPVPGDR